MIKKVSPRDLTEGDWLFKDIRIGKKTIKADFNGLSKKDISTLRKYRKGVYVKYGIPFVPVFLIAFILTILSGNVIAWLIKII